MRYLRINDTHLTMMVYEGSPESGKSLNPLFEHRALRPPHGFEANLRELCGVHEAFSQAQPTQVIVESLVTLVPLSEFEEEACDTLYRFCVTGEDELQPAMRVFYDLLPASNAALLFALPEDTCHDIEAVLGEVHYVSYLTAILQRLSTKTSVSFKRRVYVYCHDQKVDICIFEGTRILLLNTFEVQSPTDVAYYTFNLAQSLGLEKDKQPFIILGEEGKTQEIVKQLQLYVADVASLRLAAEYNRHPLTEIAIMPFDLATQILHQ